ncbi:MAG: hypothetical protein COV74_04105 [Candidatus Omnitrophica bacterium CG11_big_fil_rev_8_21_14_0_20_45_26]|uniref:Ferric uptake regulation protein n=1 Tax=Candidatus Abzuiibacterium crystallinum TaxID=1974748 RepID=A0A2H0LQB2_9BACT|nr:MAG: hypothetical protein COV74_04105 [Candidatus Omnitrophica bacterium CG11_big_fil_rev_8_21_14_0_20_45_26]
MIKKTKELDDFHKLLERKGLKYTYERQKICEEIMQLREHFDADSLYDRFKRKQMRISRDTVYRTLPLLLESGVIQKSVGAGKREFFERTRGKGHHDHMICLDCDKVVEFHSKEIEALQEKIAEEHGFKLAYHDHRLYVYCQKKNCQ